MTKETAELNIGCYFTVNGRRCQTNCVTKFGAVLHYGFVTADDTFPIIVGWIPVNLVGQCEFSK